MGARPRVPPPPLQRLHDGGSHRIGQGEEVDISTTTARDDQRVVGFWIDARGDVCEDEHVEFVVACSTREGQERLEGFLSELASDLGEQCIYLEANGEGWLVYPPVSPRIPGCA